MTVNKTEDSLVPNVFPVGMKNSELVLKDEDGNSVITQLDELSHSASELSLSPATINIENSKDVIIGPVTQFHGSVIIHQNIKNDSAAIENSITGKNGCYQNGKLVKSESTSSDASHAAEKSTKTSLLHSKHLKYIGIPVVVILIGLIVLCAVILSQKSEHYQPGGYVNQDPTEYTEEDGSLKPIGSGSFIPRSKWNALSPLSGTKQLKHPTPLVIISHTGTSMCTTVAQCSEKVLAIQNYDIDTKKLPDIGYNFLIGGDANIYVGRGWDIKNKHSNNSIAISFIGNYVRDYLTADMIASAKSLIQEGVEKAKLAKNYTIICHNQTMATQSPGSHVYEVVKKWPHFDPSSYMKISQK